MKVPEFLRSLEVRAPQVMWFLGAGASVTAGVPSAQDLIWRFKKKIYCSELRVHPALVSDLGNPLVQARIQSYFDTKGGFPENWSEEEYSHYFEVAYPNEKDRRSFLKECMSSAQPSFGHHVLAHLTKVGKTRAIWTTNFDKTIEEACARAFNSVSKLVVADLGEPSKAQRAIEESDWPLLVKLHGDYHSERLKNTAQELQQQDGLMRALLEASAKQNGFAFVGYSGRDASIMEVLETAVEARGFPNGLFWFTREDSVIPDRVQRLIDRAGENGIDAAVIEINSFDELLGDVGRFLPEIDQSALTRVSPSTVRSAPLRPEPVSSRPPFLRSNALPIISVPSVCRLVDCSIGGYQEIQKAIQEAGVDIIAQRTRAGVIAFGADADIKRAFAAYDIRGLDWHGISLDRLGRPSGELSLVYDALARCLGQIKGMRMLRSRAACKLIAETGSIDVSVFATRGLQFVSAVTGTVPNTQVNWAESVSIGLDFRLDRLWLLLRPRIALDVPEGTSAEHLATSKDFVRERNAVRRNREHMALLDGWKIVLFGKEKTCTMRALNNADGCDAVFEVNTITGFSGLA